MIRKLLLAAGTLGLIVSTATAAPPVDNINPGRHPNLAAAQRLVTEAYGKIAAAQSANEWDMQGHAAKAQELLAQANVELKAAAVAANHH